MHWDIYIPSQYTCSIRKLFALTWWRAGTATCGWTSRTRSVLDCRTIPHRTIPRYSIPWHWLSVLLEWLIGCVQREYLSVPYDSCNKRNLRIIRQNCYLTLLYYFLFLNIYTHSVSNLDSSFEYLSQSFELDFLRSRGFWYRTIIIIIFTFK